MQRFLTKSNTPTRYDAQRRLSYQEATPGSGVDATILSIQREYDEDLGRLVKITSYDNANPANGTPLNQIQYVYDDLGRKTDIYQEHNGEVNDASEDGADSLKTHFTYDVTADLNHVFTNGGRLETMTYPSGVDAEYGYGGSSTVNGRLSRIRDISFDGYSEVINYYNGTGRPVGVNLVRPDLKLDYYGDSDPNLGETPGTYAGFDRFGRVKKQWWNGYNSTPDAVEIAYGYDYAGNRVWHQDVKAATLHDEFYVYDGLNRLTNLDRGTLDANTPHVGITGTPTREEDWTLDALGNWSGYDQKTAGSITLDQTRLHNKVNEIDNDDNHANTPSNSISASTGTDWADPVHDAAGNMTTFPQPNDPGYGYTAVYDAWNRLVELVGNNDEFRYEYDGLNQRIVKIRNNEEEVRHFYYNDRWQCLEERVNELSGHPERRYLWGARYVDELILRQRTTDLDDVLDETLYALQDANFNVVALAEPDGDVVERFIYDAYGRVSVRNGTGEGDFTVKGDGHYDDSDFAWEFLYTGRRLDWETGLMYYRNRYYHTGLGRFVTRDPIGYEDSYNFYAYTSSNPLFLTDPLGLSAEVTPPTKGITGPCYIDIWAGDTLHSKESLIKFLTSNYDPGSYPLGPSRYIGVIGCGFFIPETLPVAKPTAPGQERPSISGDQKIPGFPKMPDFLPDTKVLAMLKSGLRKAEILAKKLCKNRRQFCNDGTGQRYEYGSENQRCDSVTINVEIDNDVEGILRNGRRPDGSAVLNFPNAASLRMLEELKALPKTIDCLPKKRKTAK